MLDIDDLIRNETIISDEDVAQMYRSIPDVWVLLEPEERNENNYATKVKVLNYNKEKNALRNYVMENDELLGSGSLIYFFTGHDGTCRI